MSLCTGLSFARIRHLRIIRMFQTVVVSAAAGDPTQFPNASKFLILRSDKDM